MYDKKDSDKLSHKIKIYNFYFNENCPKMDKKQVTHPEKPLTWILHISALKVFTPAIECITEKYSQKKVKLQVHNKLGQINIAFLSQISLYSWAVKEFFSYCGQKMDFLKNFQKY